MPSRVSESFHRIEDVLIYSFFLLHLIPAIPRGPWLLPFSSQSPISQTGGPYFSGLEVLPPVVGLMRRALLPLWACPRLASSLRQSPTATFDTLS